MKIIALALLSAAVAGCGHFYFERQHWTQRDTTRHTPSAAPRTTAATDLRPQQLHERQGWSRVTVALMAGGHDR